MQNDLIFAGGKVLFQSWTLYDRIKHSYDCIDKNIRCVQRKQTL